METAQAKSAAAASKPSQRNLSITHNFWPLFHHNTYAVAVKVRYGQQAAAATKVVVSMGIGPVGHKQKVAW